MFIDKGANSRFEHVATREGVRTDDDIQIGPDVTGAPREAYVRVRADGAGPYIPEFSLDGEQWDAIAAPLEDLGDPDSIRFGVKAMSGADATAAARFLYFRVDCSDRVAPVSSASVSPAQPDGEHGWYAAAPTVTLSADDGAAGGIARIEYAIDGGARQTYSEPFAVGTPGEHTVEYFATDTAAEPNVEAARTLGLRVDADAPRTGVSLDRSAGQDGPVGVTLAGQDGPAGSGSVLTQYRVDGSAWRTYAAEDEQLLDDHPASLAQWAQAGAGHFEPLEDGSGGITPVDGLGMLWYPVSQYGDFTLKFQFREGRTDGGASNGGAFVRFPDPRVPVAQRPDACARTGSAANDEAWVAIYCGHEIQLYDGQTGEPQKTGSIYNFDPVGIDEIGEPQDGWNDYEIEVVGQTYVVRRNGEEINRFQNDPGIESSRGGDPPTGERQFTQGYIGLQNHGGADTMQYRDVRVEDLSADAPGRTETGPFAITGVGPHTLEVRSVDAAGNVEAKQAVDVQIGAVAPSGQAPVPPAEGDASSFRLGSLPSRLGAKRFARRGVSAKVRCTGAMSGSVVLRVSRATARRLGLGSRTLLDRDVRCYGEHTLTVRLKPSKAIMRKLRRGARGKRTVRLEVRVRMVDFGHPAQTARDTITLR